jgi:transmembrane sensor
VASVARSASVEDLLALADVARLSGHPRDAIEPLERVVTEHAEDPRASLAALTLGRVELHSLGEPALAARAFEKAIALNIPGGLAEDARTLLAEARAKARNAEAREP